MLTLKELVPTDSGLYTCNVSNTYGWINHTYDVDVHGKNEVYKSMILIFNGSKIRTVREEMFISTLNASLSLQA